ncbi:MAG: FtsX-like permease family protein [Candidatus Moraniibacteriota bacterium]|nr:MAG: FtsX-like permease family protein [Candidatus Moranbacteria bacterium]
MSRAQRITAAIRRTPYQSAAAITLISLAFLSLSMLSLVVIGTKNLLQYFESRPQVTAFFVDTTSQEKIDQLKQQITNSVSVESSKYVTKDEALTIYRDQNRDNPMLLEMVTADILPASLEVSVKNVNDLEKVAKIMQESPEIEEVVFQKDVIDTLRRWLGGIRFAGIFLTVLLSLASILTMIMIIGLKFRSKKTEMYTLSLLGASHWYIRKPFVYESVLYGVAGAFLGWGLNYLLILYLTPNLIQFLGDIRMVPVPLWIMGLILVSEIGVGIVLGLVSSAIATRRLGR